MIKSDHLRKRYRKQLAVDNVSFEVHAGKVTGFLGPNGAGKSTTMRLMLGLDHGEGTTTFDGKPLHAYTRPSQVIGLLLEAKAFHPSRTARHHLRILAAAGDIADARVDEALDMVGLRSAADKRPGKFSLGMSQRLGIAAAILGKPKYLMLDEPGNGLDPEGIAWLRQFIKDYADAGNAVFVSSHLLSEMSQMADDIVVIGKGKLIAQTSMRQLLASGGGSVYVRSTQVTKLSAALSAKNVTFERHEDGLRVHGMTSDQIGKMAFKAGLAVLELRPENATLEQAFLQLTEGSSEYHGHSVKESAS